MARQDNNRVNRIQANALVHEDLIQIMWRGRWVALAVMIVSVLTGLVYVRRIPPVYASTSRIYVEPSGPRILTEAEGVMTQSKNYLYTQAELLKSTPILLSALEHTGTKGLKLFGKVGRPVAYLKEQALEVSVGKQDDIISISLESPDPNEAAELVNAVVDSYIAYHATQKRSTTGEILRVLQNEKQERDNELARKLKVMMEFKSENNALAFERQNGNLILDSLDQLSTEMRQAQLQTIEAKSDLDMIKSMVADPVRLKQFIEAEKARGVYALTIDEKTRLTTEVERLRTQLADLSLRVTPKHPWIETLQQRLDDSEKQLAKLDAEFAQAQVGIAQRRYEAAREKEMQIMRYFDEQRQLAIELNKKQAEYRILESEWEQTKKLCDILDDRIKEINVTEDVACLYISILERANPAETPSGPNKSRYMAYTFLLGSMLSVSLTILRDRVDQRFKSAEEISATLGMPVLGTVPAMPQRQSVGVRGRKAYLDPGSSWAQAYRRICDVIHFDSSGGKTILVTSPTTLEDRSILASNLAITMAQAGHNTLLLDADFRRAEQHEIFDANHENMGLTTILSGTTTSAQAAQPTQVKGLDLLQYGPDVLNPSGMLDSDRMGQLLDILADRYDRVVVDSPPVVPTNGAGTLAAACNATILAVAANKSRRKTTFQARDALLKTGARILGVVVSDVVRESDSGCYGIPQRYDGGNGSVCGEREETDGRRPAAMAFADRSDQYAAVPG